MSVYVDAIRRTGRTSAWPFSTAAHLLADSVDELHAFASRIGLKRAWYHRTSTPHYDITMRMHARAMAAGARLVSRVELVEIVRRLREEERARRAP